MPAPAKLPRTPAEWQTAVDAAEGALHFSSAQQYGLVEGGPQIDEERCVQILKLGKARGIRPAPDAPEQFVAALMSRNLQ